MRTNSLNLFKMIHSDKITHYMREMKSKDDRVNCGSHRFSFISKIWNRMEPVNRDQYARLENHYHMLAKQRQSSGRPLPQRDMGPLEQDVVCPGSRGEMGVTTNQRQSASQPKVSNRKIDQAIGSNSKVSIPQSLQEMSGRCGGRYVPIAPKRQKLSSEVRDTVSHSRPQKQAKAISEKGITAGYTSISAEFAVLQAQPFGIVTEIRSPAAYAEQAANLVPSENTCLPYPSLVQIQSLPTESDDQTQDTLAAYNGVSPTTSELVGSEKNFNIDVRKCMVNSQVNAENFEQFVMVSQRGVFLDLEGNSQFTENNKVLNLPPMGHVYPETINVLISDDLNVQADFKTWVRAGLDLSNILPHQATAENLFNYLKITVNGLYLDRDGRANFQEYVQVSNPALETISQGDLFRITLSDHSEVLISPVIADSYGTSMPRESLQGDQSGGNGANSQASFERPSLLNLGNTEEI